MNDLIEYKRGRTFNAPRDMVWRVWTEPELLARWYGPGLETIIHAHDLRPGGEWRNEMKWGDNSALSKLTYLEVEPAEKLVWHHSSVDSDWKVRSNPMMPDWPRVVLNTVVFEEKGDHTQVSMSLVPIDATQAEIACFTEKMSVLDGGWNAGYKIIDEILVELMAN